MPEVGGSPILIKSRAMRGVPAAAIGIKEFGFARRTTVGIIEVQGLNAVLNHFPAIIAVTNALAPEILKYSGMAMAAKARQILEARGNIRTRDTLRSTRLRGMDIADHLTGEPEIFSDSSGNIWVDFISEGGRTGLPDQRAARFLEYGFVHAGSGRFVGPFPYMFPATDWYTPKMLLAFRHLAELPNRIVRILDEGTEPPTMAQAIQKFRNQMYTAAKFAGDIQVIFPGAFGGARGYIYSSARVLGDFQAGIEGTMASRMTRRVVGRWSGAGISFTRSVNLAGMFTSPAGKRIWNRVVGKEIGRLGLRRFD